MLHLADEMESWNKLHESVTAAQMPCTMMLGDTAQNELVGSVQNRSALTQPELEAAASAPGSPRWKVFLEGILGALVRLLRSKEALDFVEEKIVELIKKARKRLEDVASEEVIEIDETGTVHGAVSVVRDPNGTM